MFRMASSRREARLGTARYEEQCAACAERSEELGYEGLAIFANTVKAILGQFADYQDQGRGAERDYHQRVCYGDRFKRARSRGELGMRRQIMRFGNVQVKWIYVYKFLVEPGPNEWICTLGSGSRGARVPREYRAAFVRRAKTLQKAIYPRLLLFLRTKTAILPIPTPSPRPASAPPEKSVNFPQLSSDESDNYNGAGSAPKRGRPNSSSNYKKEDPGSPSRSPRKSYRLDNERPERDVRSLETKYKQLLRKKKPTGDAKFPPDVKHGHRIEDLINQRADTRELNDS
ncbi:hypothetical protein DFH09DRAFT_1078555 [Mycena vulgaris]|nr:hypothetical protein DFH09DRAFT_1078555 [Mycena vulgaris]